MNDFEHLQLSGTPTQCVAHVSRYVSALGYDYWAYCTKFVVGNAPGAHWSLHNFPVPLWAVHKGCNGRMTDPIPRLCREEVLPQVWAVSDEAPSMEVAATSNLLEFIDGAAGHGVRAGMCVPIHDYGNSLGSLTLATLHDVSRQELLAQRSMAMLFAACLHRACRSYVKTKKINPAGKLTPREVECLSWASRGKTSWEIGKVLSISEHTVAFHMHNAIEKLGAVSRQQAIAKSIMLGVVTQ